MRGIIVEGIDCSGKTTLINRIKYRFKRLGGIDVKELEYLDCRSQYERYLLEYTVSGRTIFHRSHISEMVFSRFFGRERPFNEPEATILRNIVANDYVVVLATIDFGMFARRIKEARGNEVIGIGDYERIVGLYEESMNDIRYLRYCSESLDSVDVMSEVVIREYNRE